jgi:hypothetical protein
MPTPDPSHTVSIRIVLDPAAETISGRIEGGDPFTGWLQLAAALQTAARDGLDPQGPEPPPVR